MLMKELGVVDIYVQREPPFIHPHGYRQVVFAPLSQFTMIYKVRSGRISHSFGFASCPLLQHNSKLKVCGVLFAHLPVTLTVNGKCVQVSEDGGFHW